MILSIVQHTPVRIWGLLAVLVALGLSQTRPREMSLLRITLLPLLLLGLSLAGVFHSFGHVPLAFGGWGAGVAAALVFARDAVAVRGASWSPARSVLHVPGSWLPLALMVGLFTVKYVAGASLALHPALAGNAAFAGACGFAYGAFSGLFLARAWSLRSVVGPSHSLQAA